MPTAFLFINCSITALEPRYYGGGTGSDTGTGTGAGTSSGTSPNSGSSSGGPRPSGSGGSSSGNSTGTGTTSSGGTGTDAGTGSGGGEGGTSSGVTGSGSGGGGGASGDAGQGGASLCAQTLAAGATLCDGFETTPSDFTVMATAPDTFVLDTTKFYRGSKSMKFTATNAAYITETKTFTGTTKATNNAFWGRYFFFNNMTTAPMSHSVFGTMHGTDATANAEDFHFVGGSRGKLQAQIQFAADEYTDNMKMPAAADPPFPLAADGWQCWEWQIQPDDSFDFYINGTEVMEMKIVAGKAAMSGANFAPLPVVTTLEIGREYFVEGLLERMIDASDPVARAVLATRRALRRPEHESRRRADRVDSRECCRREPKSGVGRSQRGA